MNKIAESYVKLVLAMGIHDEGYVDAYYGPEEWRTEVEREKPSLDDIAATAAGLSTELAAITPPKDEELRILRHQYLAKQLDALQARVRMLKGEKLTFDEESKALYDAVAPTHPMSYFQDAIDALDEALPGDGPLADRLKAFRDEFVIPPDKLDAVFKAAIDECRERTARYIELPGTESFEIEYVTDKPWSAYNWYKGNYHSLIQVNEELPVRISRAIDLACHEGYPGHHVYNVLLEHHLMRERGWVEFSVYALFSPQSLIAEGTANFGIEVAFPGDERVRFEREVLFPIAGIDPERAEKYYEVEALTDKLSYASNEAARLYLDGKIDADEAAKWLVDNALYSPKRAEQRVRFMDTYRSYVINYNLGEDLVRAYVERMGGTEDRPEERWAQFARLISSPRLPSGLK